MHTTVTCGLGWSGIPAQGAEAGSSILEQEALSFWGDFARGKRQILAA